MKAITIHQPYASLIVCGAKRFETRHWETSYRGPIAIHAGKSTESLDYVDDYEVEAYCGCGPADLPMGAVVGVANLVGCHRMTPALIEQTPMKERNFGYWEEGRFAWELTDIERFAEPISSRGFQAIWDWDATP